MYTIYWGLILNTCFLGTHALTWSVKWYTPGPFSSLANLAPSNNPAGLTKSKSTSLLRLVTNQERPRRLSIVPEKTTPPGKADDRDHNRDGDNGPAIPYVEMVVYETGGAVRVYRMGLDTEMSGIYLFSSLHNQRGHFSGLFGRGQRASAEPNVTIKGRRVHTVIRGLKVTIGTEGDSMTTLNETPVTMVTDGSDQQQLFKEFKVDGILGLGLPKMYTIVTDKGEKSAFTDTLLGQLCPEPSATSVAFLFNGYAPATPQDLRFGRDSPRDQAVLCQSETELQNILGANTQVIEASLDKPGRPSSDVSLASNWGSEPTTTPIPSQELGKAPLVINPLYSGIHLDRTAFTKAFNEADVFYDPQVYEYCQTQPFEFGLKLTANESGHLLELGSKELVGKSEDRSSGRGVDTKYCLGVYGESTMSEVPGLIRYGSSVDQTPFIAGLPLFRKYAVGFMHDATTKTSKILIAPHSNRLYTPGKLQQNLLEPLTFDESFSSEYFNTIKFNGQ
ncbi:hypothetical protein H4R33_002363 [Dimargaris cristalligena]|nr:hypothetical protein H4R33_002363 [Dimargaris cristalligena]